jgi:hypothetical protein
MSRAALLGCTALALVLFTMPVSARIIEAWECGKLVTVELRKHGTAAYELAFSGALVFSGPGSGINFKYVGRKGANLNGKPCRVLPYDPKWDENEPSGR